MRIRFELVRFLFRHWTSNSGTQQSPSPSRNRRTRQRAHLAELDTLFASLQSRAFRGDL